MKKSKMSNTRIRTRANRDEPRWPVYQSNARIIQPPPTNELNAEFMHYVCPWSGHEKRHRIPSDENVLDLRIYAQGTQKLNRN